VGRLFQGDPVDGFVCWVRRGSDGGFSAALFSAFFAAFLRTAVPSLFGVLFASVLRAIFEALTLRLPHLFLAFKARSFSVE
jgi:hypothetical protein